jgi:hypothetical protein
MSFENPLWGAPKIHGELLKLVDGVEIHGAYAGSAVADLEDLPSQSCGGIASIDLFVVPTVAFEQLIGFLLLWP